ncbi:hypothetical protein IEO21_09085 [Rhodonia placenta]|uniref:Uncharacterized protein n=1 Tax=Rhodonia placenta TaxID=104341 RepID=A0A8H7NV73_9APHY|nr:hypothetical protein IEO21_09085 [Postia placenta]
MDNSTEPCKHYESFGEVDEEDVGWIADACDDLAENMDSGTVPYYLTENVHHPMTREDLIEDGLGYNTSVFASCADTDNVSTALAPGLHMADQNATTNEYDAHTDGEEDLFNEQDREELPIDTLWKDVALQLEASLKVESSNGVACAASARLWEGLLEDHRVPYLLLRVADMRFVLGSQRRNPGKLDSSDSAFSIIGYSGTAMWKTVSKKASNADRFFNLHCIERTVIEGVVMFDVQTRYDIIMDGLDEKAVPVDDSSIVAGTCHWCALA